MDRIAQGNASPCESSGVVNYRDLLWCIYDELSTCVFVQRGRGFPTPPEISTTLLFNSAILLQVFFTPLAQFILNQDEGCSSWGSKYSSFNMYIGCFGCLLPALLYCGKNNRMLAENQESTFSS